jgi:hypothetical protein
MSRVMHDEVPDAVSPPGPTIMPWTSQVITEWRNGFGRTPSPGHRGTHTRWSVIAKAAVVCSQWFARESIVIIHHFSCTHITIAFFVCFTPLLLITTHCSSTLHSSYHLRYLRFIHSPITRRLISRYLYHPPTRQSHRHRYSIRCLLATPPPSCQSRIMCVYLYMTICRAPSTVRQKKLMQFQRQISLIESNTLRHISRFLRSCSLSIYPSPPRTTARR